MATKHRSVGLLAGRAHSCALRCVRLLLQPPRHRCSFARPCIGALVECAAPCCSVGERRLDSVWHAQRGKCMPGLQVVRKIRRQSAPQCIRFSVRCFRGGRASYVKFGVTPSISEGVRGCEMGSCRRANSSRYLRNNGAPRKGAGGGDESSQCKSRLTCRRIRLWTIVARSLQPCSNTPRSSVRVTSSEFAPNLVYSSRAWPTGARNSIRNCSDCNCRVLVEQCRSVRAEAAVAESNSRGHVR